MHYWLLIGILFAAGLLGGLCSYYLLAVNEYEHSSNSQLPAVVIGLVAAFTSPLALHFLGNTWIKEAETNHSFYFLIFAFSLVAAAYSRRFLDSVNRRVLAEVQEAKKEVEEIKEQITEPASNKRSEGEVSVAAESTALSEDEIKVIRSISNSKFTYRTLGGIAAELKLDIPIARQLIARLVTGGYLVEKRMKAGGLSYGVTHKGYLG